MSANEKDGNQNLITHANGIWRAEREFLRGSANLKREKCIKSDIQCVRLSTSRNDDYVVTLYFIS